MLKQLLMSSALVALCTTGVFAEGKSKFVPISKGVKSIEMELNGEKFTLMRNQSKNSKITPLYETTFRGAPQPISLAKGVETVGELEFIELMKKAQSDENIAIVDSRTPGWYARLRVPGAVNVPYTSFESKDEAVEILEDEFDVEMKAGKLDFSKAKTLVVYCNGYWCGQTPHMIKNAEFALLKMGYPAEKIKYYRGGMQAWTSLGFTVAGSAAK